MKRLILLMVAMITIIVGMVTAFFMTKPKNKEVPNNIKTEYIKESKEIKEEKVSEKKEDITLNKDEIEDTINTSFELEKISPNTIMIFKTKFKKCGHEKEEYLEIPEQMVNKEIKELKQIYSEWEIEKGEKDELILKKEVEGECGEHYKVREKDERIAIYEIDKDGKEKEYEITDVSTEYMTKEDRNKLEDGIIINGKSNLNKYIEDFE